jgi:hypothetical protein
MWDEMIEVQPPEKVETKVAEMLHTAIRQPTLTTGIKHPLTFIAEP